MSIARRSQWIAAGLVLATAALMLLLVTAMNNARLGDRVAQTLQARAEVQAAAIASTIRGAIASAQEIAAGPALADYLGTGDRGPLTGRLRALAATRPEILQARYLDAQGREQVRVDRRVDRVVATPVAALQDKSHRRYVTEMRALRPGEGYVSSLNLNRENGRVQRPLTPTVRVGAPVFDAAGRRLGQVVLNLRATHFLPQPVEGDMSLRIVSATGEYLLHPDPGWRFGQDLGTGRDYAAEFGQPPPDPATGAGAAALDRAREGGSERLDSAHVWLKVPGAVARDWLIVTSMPRALRTGLAMRDLLRLSLAVGLIAALATAVAWWAIRRVTGRLGDIARVAQQIAETGGAVRAEAGGSDEVATLAHAFNRMADELQATIARESEARHDLELANRELKRSNADLESFAHAAAHDLKTPLRSMRLLPTFIEEDLEVVGDTLAEYLDELRLQAVRMEELVDGLLRYSLLGRDGSTPETFDPAPVAERVLAACALPRSFTLRTDIGPARITFVKVEFEIAVRNMVQNAVKHHDRAEGTVTVRLREAAGRTVLEVEDDGPGIPADQRAQVMLPLRTGKSKEEGGGTGLGLAFIAKIAARWNGSLTLDDAPGRGTVVRLSLPGRQGAAESGAADDPVAGADGAGDGVGAPGTTRDAGDIAA